MHTYSYTFLFFFLKQEANIYRYWLEVKNHVTACIVRLAPCLAWERRSERCFHSMDLGKCFIANKKGKPLLGWWHTTKSTLNRNAFAFFWYYYQICMVVLVLVSRLTSRIWLRIVERALVIAHPRGSPLSRILKKKEQESILRKIKLSTPPEKVTGLLCTYT